MQSGRMSVVLAGMVEAAVETYAAGEALMWEVIPGVTQNGPMVLILTMMPGALLDTVVHSQVVIQSPTTADQDAVNRLIKSLVDGMLAERSKQLAEANGGSPGGGIQLPGS